jgi:CheY-like chemotaxis protein
LSLTGNLEDLPLLDILQIVTYSRKTGFLAIDTRDGQGAIVFNDGLVVSAFNPGLESFQPPAGLDRERRQALVRRRIEIALEKLTRLREGQFQFSLTESTPIQIGDRDIKHELVEDGINAQGLLLDLARGIDEDRRDSAAALEASFAQPPDEPASEAAGGAEGHGFVDLAAPGEVEEVDEADIGPLPDELTSVPVEEVQAATEPHLAPSSGGAAAADETPAILLVDDEADVRQILAESFTGAGYQVIEADDTDAAVKKANRLGKAGIRFILVCDLGMPTSGGRSFQGGFEVVKKMWKMHMRIPVLLMAERVNAALQARSKQMGIDSLVFKPGLSKLDPEQFRADLRAFADRLNKDILPRLGDHARAEVKAPSSHPDHRPVRPGPVGGEEVSREIAVLQERLDELRRQADPTQISLLVMKTAREFFERGILLLIKDAEARGLAGFGNAPRGENINLLVRDVAIPLNEASAFADTVSRRRPYLGVTADDGKWMAHFYGKVGRFRASNAAILPLLAHRETIALLFGDNPETGRDVKRLDALVLFIDQAGLALENLFLQRKIQNLEGGAA